MTVGCATHTAAIVDRDGGIVATGDLIDIEYNRVLNDASTARATFGVSGPGCCEQLANIRSWRHSLWIYRDDDFVWAGPVVNVDWSYDRVIVDATDIIGQLDLRVPHQTFTYTGTDLIDIAEDLIDDGLEPDDPGHTVTKMGESGVTGGWTFTGGVGQVGDHLRDLADTGLDFTAVGNNIVLLPDEFCEVVGRLSDEDLPEGLTVTEDGAALATRWVVAGTGFTGTAGGIDPYYGLLERYVEQTSITSQAGATAAAQSRLRSSAVTPTVINTQNITISPTANVKVLQLVPGWCLDVTTSITCRSITQRLKITGLQVSEDGGSEETPGQERILVQVATTSAEGTT